MNTLSLKRLLLGSALVAWASVASAAALTVSPSLITNDYVGKITFTITGLAAGQSVVLEKFADLNANGSIDAGETAIQGGLLMDGFRPTIGGVRNLNVPGDEDGMVNGQIRMELPYPGGEAGLAVIAGRYLIRVSNPVGGAALVTSPFEVRQRVLPQSVKGRLTGLGTGIPLVNRQVVLLPADSDPVTGAVTDAGGNYTLYGQPGGYTVLALAPGYVGDFQGAVNLVAGAAATLDLALPTATRTLAGKLKDSASGAGIPGVFIQATSGIGQFAAAFSGPDGTYSVPVVAGSWKVKPSSGSLLQVGYLGLQQGSNVSTVGGNVANLDLPVDPATALIHGSLRNRQGNPVVGIEIYSDDQNNRYDVYGARSLSPNADYCVGVRPGSWWVGPNSEKLNALGYTSRGTNVTVTTDQALRVDFTLEQVSAHLVGRVVDDAGAPVADIGIRANDQNGQANSAKTDTNGNFNLGVSGGAWNLGLITEDAEQRQLISPELPVPLADGETRSGIVLVARHRTATIHGLVKNTSAARLANVAVYHSINLQGTNYSARVRTDASGNYQLPAFNGTWQVSLECYDLQSQGYVCAAAAQAVVAGADVALDFVVQAIAPLQVATSSLAAASVGYFYSTQLQASGGLQPYRWALSPGSNPLPSGLSLGTDGILDGIPSIAGTFNFSVRVTDMNFQSATDRQLSLVVKPVSAPLHVITSSLANGSVGTFYSQLFSATGGQQPYTWSLAPGSAPLPQGLILASGGTLSGTPTDSGTFFFNVRVTDVRSSTADGLLSIYLSAPPLQITTLAMANAQQGESYTAQLQALGGRAPYRWSIAPGSLGLPAELNLSATGIISGTSASEGTFYFIVRVTDSDSAIASQSLALIVDPKPTLTALERNADQFLLRLTGGIGRTYAVQSSAGVAGPNWLPLVTTNMPAGSVVIIDPRATDAARFYRVRSVQ